MKKKAEDAVDDLRPEYDFGRMDGTRGRYAARYAEGSNIVRLEPDVAELFPDSDAVNRALRALADIARRQSENLKAS